MKKTYALSLSATLAFVLVALLTADRSLETLDQALLTLAPLTHVPPVTGFTWFVAYGLGTIGLSGLSVIAMIWAWRMARVARPEILLFGGLMLSASLALSGLKLLFGRARPDVFPWLVEVGGLSFPSGHTAMNLLFWGMLASWLPKGWLRIGAISLGILAGPTRIIAGVHWPSDVLAGWCFALFFLGLWFAWRPRARV